jgi:formylglycine-generating enzyme required for sulfatase activity
MSFFSRLALASCSLGVIGGFGLVAYALKPLEAPAATSATSQPMIAVAAGSASVRGIVASAGPLQIDALEVSVAEYEGCVRAGACTLQVTAAGVSTTSEYQRGESTRCTGGRGDRPNAPINCVDYAAAEAYCKWAGKRLPTRDEWWLAIAPRQEERRSEVHRELESGHYYWGEWTTTPVEVAGRGTVDLLRYTAGSSIDESGKFRGLGAEAGHP